MPHVMHQVPVGWLNFELHNGWHSLIPENHHGDFESFGSMTFTKFEPHTRKPSKNQKV
ncbi:hypothetical protein TWF481_001309 [Arthrobotrys musiformis]|uniref:Uncharacterized protein n=1 Tax=Arthrobotrys musiformis TaxID=47236 RepID=A0AAV9WQE9_9PEZI